MMRYTFHVERPSNCRTWFERFLVEVRAKSIEEAKACLAFTLSDSESIVACVGGHQEYSDAA